MKQEVEVKTRTPQNGFEPTKPLFEDRSACLAVTPGGREGVKAAVFDYLGSRAGKRGPVITCQAVGRRLNS